MINLKRRRPYWRRTKSQILSNFALPAIIMMVVPFFATLFDPWYVLGFPLGYFLVVHGTIFVGMIAVFRFVSYQDKVDRWHGAHEDF